MLNKDGNEDSSLSLSKDTTTDIMGNMKFRTADSDTARFYPYVEYQIGEGVTPTGTATVTGTVTPKQTNVTTPIGETPTVTETKPPAAATPAATATAKTEPGFEAGLAIAGLLAVAYLVLRQRINTSQLIARTRREQSLHLFLKRSS